MRRGKVVYDKVVIRDIFVKGIERIIDGVNKGYRIAVFGRSIDPTYCDRTKYVARYLYENFGWKVLHILGNGSILSHKTLQENIEKNKLARQRIHAKSSELGKDGEEIAGKYLINHGFTILDKNWNLHRGCELDIVAFKDNKLHVVEVKTRMYKDGEEVHPEFAVNYRKMKHIIKAIYAYRAHNGFYNIAYQIDCVAIVYRDEEDYGLHFYQNLKLPN